MSRRQGGAKAIANATATLARAPPQRLTRRLAGTGRLLSRVSLVLAGIGCPVRCLSETLEGNLLSVPAAASDGRSAGGWGYPRAADRWREDDPELEEVLAGVYSTAGCLGGDSRSVMALEDQLVVHVRDGL